MKGTKYVQIWNIVATYKDILLSYNTKLYGKIWNVIPYFSIYLHHD
jgi:hypothetical protein